MNRQDQLARGALESCRPTPDRDGKAVIRPKRELAHIGGTRKVTFPLVSVIIPVFNSAKYIEAALNSVLAQDYPAIEIIVVDDGSTDNSPEIIRKFGPQIHLLTQSNQGSGAARNLGIENANGKFIAFLDADDIWWQHKLSAQMHALLSSDHKMIYSRFIRWYANSDGTFSSAESEFESQSNHNISKERIVTGALYANLLLDCIVWTSTVIVESAALKRSGMFDVSLRKGQDYDLWLRLSREISMLGLEKATALYRIHSESITRSARQINYEYLILSKAITQWGYPSQDVLAEGLTKRLAKSCRDHGLGHLRFGDPIIAARSFEQSLRHQGIDIKLGGLWLAAIVKYWFRRILNSTRTAEHR